MKNNSYSRNTPLQRQVVYILIEYYIFVSFCYTGNNARRKVMRYFYSSTLHCSLQVGLCMPMCWAFRIYSGWQLILFSEYDNAADTLLVGVCI